ncbi:Ubiquitin carboxyl-terminal hydrolase 20 [Capsicum baccatum]|uniref:Ubiquitin carboxyl-terminal hydrolase 20 n=1 Tax=Capsicum baccatum TaxID=33114 RepID=A0A2G2W3N5_CAPBA|nr:Ubiquitin carboxyl-terminal hydrolase 20 [Capsicum baccatum]
MVRNVRHGPALVQVVTRSQTPPDFSSGFHKYEQEDAHEFLQCFLNRLETRCSDIVQQVFGVRLISKLCFCNCGHYSKTFEPLIDVSLEIKDADSLHSVLELFTTVEKLDDPEIKYTCERYFVALQMHNVDTIPKLSFSLPNHPISDVSDSNAVAIDTSSLAPRPTGAINSSYFHELMKIVDNELKKTAQTFTPGPPGAVNSSKENNASKDIGVIETMTPSRPHSTQGKLIFNFNLLMDPEQETEIMMACSMIKRRVPGPRGEELMTALRRLGNRGSSLNEKRQKMEVSLSRKMEIRLFAFRELPWLPNLRNAAMSS